jgi:hypothetical protein
MHNNVTPNKISAALENIQKLLDSFLNQFPTNNTVDPILTSNNPMHGS